MQTWSVSVDQPGSRRQETSVSVRRRSNAAASHRARARAATPGGSRTTQRRQAGLRCRTDRRAWRHVPGGAASACRRRLTRAMIGTRSAIKERMKSATSQGARSKRTAWYGEAEPQSIVADVAANANQREVHNPGNAGARRRRARKRPPSGRRRHPSRCAQRCE